MNGLDHRRGQGRRLGGIGAGGLETGIGICLVIGMIGELPPFFFLGIVLTVVEEDHVHHI